MGEEHEQGPRTSDSAEDHTPPPGSRPPSGELLERLSKHAPKEPRYRLMGEVARGGMGAILRVWDDDLQRTLAMKVVLGKADRTGDTPDVDERTLGRFLDEAQVTGQLDHPGIVPVHELGLDDNGQVYFTMKLVKGHDLATVFEWVEEREGNWTLTRALEVLLKVCDAMAFAHDRRVVHRDLKPANVMVGRFGEVYVMDWGLARVLDREDNVDVRPVVEPPETVVLAEARPQRRAEPEEQHEEDPAEEPALLTKDGDVLGTPYYMSPEQGRGELDRIGPTSDVYSLGAMLYHLLAGCMPYAWPGERTSPLNILDRLLKGPPPPVAELKLGLPPELVAICEKAMAREPEDRYPGMQDLARDLRAFLDQRVVQAYRTGAVIEFKKWVRRNRPMATSLAALVLAVAGAGFALAFVESRRVDQAREDAARERSLMDSSLARDLLQRADQLFPVHPGTIPAMEAWCLEARELLTRKDSALRELTRRQLLGTPEDPDREQSTALWNLELKQEEFGERIERSRSALRQGGQSPEQRRADEATVAALGYALEQTNTALQADALELPREAAYAFGAAEESLEYERLSTLLHAFDRLDHPTLGALAKVERRLERARHVARMPTLHEAAWLQARESIADPDDCPEYSSLSGPIAIRPGLAPLGRNPHTGLWEFWHFLSGARPLGDAESGWQIAPETGMVFVLVPGGTRVFGATRSEDDSPNANPNASANEGPPVPATLAAFYISKFEMTQAQWLRAAGTIPSRYQGGEHAADLTHRITWTHPVESVTWVEAVDALGHWNLTLPTELQWEFVARAGWLSPLALERDARVLEGRANLRDTSFARIRSVERFAPWDDEFAVHAPVGSFEPNPIGLHDLEGNVSELLLDWHCGSLGEGQLGHIVTGTGELVPLRYRNKHTYRGSSWMDLPESVSVTTREPILPSFRDSSLGLRAALPLD